jgi:two-component system, OmpR family, response regulator TctD
VRILIVEDNQALAEGTSKVLRDNGYTVDVVANGADADAAIAANAFDLVVLDLSLPDMDGLEVLDAMRQRDDRTAVLVLTARGALDDRVRGLDLGADDYMSKPFEVRELEARIRVLVRRQAGLRTSTLSFGPLSLNLNTSELSAGGEVIDLPNREISILRTMMLSRNRVVAKSQIIETLSGFDGDISDNAVEQYISRLRRKLTSFGIGIKVARGVGYYLHRLSE